MSNNILLSTSQGEISLPYKFKNTNIKVYSIEEAMYHSYHYFKQSVEDFTSEEFISWVNDVLGLTVISVQLKKISLIQSFSNRLIQFLSVIDYFSDEQLETLSEELILWENRLEWERLKERADYLVKNEELDKAISLYTKAITYGENSYLYNNLAIAFMKKGRFGEAYDILKKAYNIEKNVDIIVNFCESAIYFGKFDEAKALISELEKISNTNDIYYLKGLKQFELKSYNDAIIYFEKGFEKTKDDCYLYKISDIYIIKRNYEKAISILDDIIIKDTKYFCKVAEIQVKNLNVSAAVKCMQRAIMTDKDNINVWINLAKYHRLNYDVTKASSSISKALDMDPNNDLAKIEQARIKKSQGKIKEYQGVLHSVLDGFRRKYRDLLNV